MTDAPRIRPTGGVPAERWRPETALVLACARARMTETDRVAAQAALDRRPDWQAVLTMAAAHGLVPLLHRHAAAGHLAVPSAPMTALTARAFAGARRSLRLAASLLDLLATFAKAGIAAVPLKGPVLSELVYGSAMLRRCRDLDVLFAVQDLPAVERLLVARGARVVRNFSPALDALAFEKAHHLSIVLPEGVKLEAHYHMVPAYGARRFDYDTLASSLVTTTFQGATIQTLSREHQMVYLCQHGASHAWSCLEWVVSIAELVRQDLAGDWARVGQLAASLGEHSRVTAAIDLADRLIGPVRPAAGSPTAGGSAANAAVESRLRRDPVRVIAHISEPFAYQVRTDDTWRARLGRCWTTLAAPTPSDSLGVALPRSLWPLYYAFRPLRLVLHHGRRLLSSGPPSSRPSPHNVQR